MTYIKIWYFDRDGCITSHEIETGAEGLMYDDPFIEPVEVRKIIKNGFSIGRISGYKDGLPTMSRSGKHISPYRITEIEYHDDYF